MKLIAIALWCLTASTLAIGQDYPAGPVKIITPFAAGSGADIVARLIAERLSGELKQPVIVDNRVGAGGNIGMGIAAKSTPDGYTLVLGTSGPLTVNPTLYGSIPFDPIKDFTPISVVAVGPMVIATNAASNFKTLRDLLTAAKATPQSLNYGTPGVGSAPHLAAAILLSVSGAEMTHIPYKGNGEAMTELIAGRLDAMSSGLPSVAPFAQSGKIRLLAVTGPTRSAMLPGVPSVVEAGYPNAQSQVWYGLLAPANTPRAIVDKLHTAVEQSLKQSGMKERLLALGLEPAANTPDEFRSLIKQDGDRLGKLIRAMGMKAE